MYIKYVITAAGWLLIPYWTHVLYVYDHFFCHVVFLNFSGLDLHCLLKGQHRSRAGFHNELHVVVSNVYLFNILPF